MIEVVKGRRRQPPELNVNTYTSFTLSLTSQPEHSSLLKIHSDCHGGGEFVGIEYTLLLCKCTASKIVPKTLSFSETK